MQKSVFGVAQEELPNCVEHKGTLDLPPHPLLTPTPGYKYLSSVGCCGHHDLENENVWTDMSLNPMSLWKASRAVSL